MSEEKKPTDQPPSLFSFTTFPHKEEKPWGGPAFDEFKREENISKHGLSAICTLCAGTGNKQTGKYDKCDNCKGTGLLQSPIE